MHGLFSDLTDFFSSFEKDRVILKLIRGYFAIPESEYSDEEILGILGILYVNAHEVPVTPIPVQGLYLNASLIEHSCVNNASKHFDTNGNLQIRAAVHIRKGEHISIMYSDPMWGTPNRSQHLAETKFFKCGCKRCRDPLELGTHFSSLRCPSCPVQQQGFLVATDPVDAAAPWRCGQCGAEEPAEYVNAVIRSIGEELIRLEKGSPEACLGFIKKHSQNLHRNHFYLMDVKLALCQMIGKSAAGEHFPGEQGALMARMASEIAEKDLVLKQKLCMELIEVANVISPGIA